MKRADGKTSQYKKECKQCDNKAVEDEQHFIIICSRYYEDRLKLFDKIKQSTTSKWDLTLKNQEEQFILLINGTGDEFEMIIFTMFQNFLIKSFRTRNQID